MELSYFALSRDLLYFSSLLVGASAGAFIIIRRKTCTLRQRSRWITVILCLISSALASLAASVILTRGAVFSITSVYYFIILFLVLGAAGISFPRAGGCTIIFITGICAVWLSFSFFAYPRFDEPARLVIRSSGSEYVFHKNDSTWNFRNDGGTLTVEAVSITAYSGFPLIGGERRGLITEVLQNNERLFTLAERTAAPDHVRTARQNSSLSIGDRHRVFSREFHFLDLPMGALLPGVGLPVLFDGNKLYFDTSIRN